MLNRTRKTQIDFWGTYLWHKKARDIHYWSFSMHKYLIAFIFDKANDPNWTKLLDMDIENHSVPRTIRWNQAKRFVGYQIKNFCNINNPGNWTGSKANTDYQEYTCMFACIKEKKVVYKLVPQKECNKGFSSRTANMPSKKQRFRTSKNNLDENLIPRWICTTSKLFNLS